MKYSEIKELIASNQRVILFGSMTGKQLYDTRTSKRNSDEKYDDTEVSAVWTGTKQRTRGFGYPLSDTCDTVLCLYLKGV